MARKLTIAPTAPALHAPAGEGQAETETAKRQVAKHYLLDANGEVVEKEEEATGIRYHHIATGKTTDQQSGLPAGGAATMWAVFGMKTLATNEASAVRQKEGDLSDQVAAIEERFDLNRTGVWADRTREGGPRVDLDALASAVVEVQVQKGQIAADDAAKGAQYAKVRQMLESKEKVAAVRQVKEVTVEYARIVGKSVKSADDLASIIG